MASRDGNEKIRTFIAVSPDADARQAVADVVRALAASPGGDAVRWVPPENLHVTLRFLGGVEASRLPELTRRVGGEVAGLPRFELRFAGVSAFPSPRRPRVVVFALEPEAPLAALAAAVERGVVASGFDPEERGFRAHLTLGRAKRGRRLSPVTASVTAAGEAFQVGEAVLFRSDLERGGARYTPLERMALGGASHPESNTLED